MHATSAERAAALADIATRCKAQRPDLYALLTVAPDVAPPAQLRRIGIDHMERLANDGGNIARQFLAHWAPDVGLWAGLPLIPGLIHKAGARKMPMILADISRDDAVSLRGLWRGGQRSTLGLFDPILTTGPSATDAIRRLVRTPDQVEESARLSVSVTPPVFDETAFEDLTGQLAGRPVWLAAGLERAEFDTVVAAHRMSVRLSHRLLLVAHVAHPDEAQPLVDTMHRPGLRAERWDPDTEIEDNIQAVVCEDPEALGLWYRAAPVTFLGGSLTPQTGGQCPLPAAALGSAILHGPHVRNHGASYVRLEQVGAARTVTNANELSVAVTRLSAPDAAAAMALAGWTVATEGAGLADRLVELVQAKLDARP
tara:strand:- start:5786 stop:6895 length:1110 start_codon:yes stop_codon:yes gene_type:complete